MAVTVVGSYLSPYVRKVLACLHLKNVQYRIDPIVPFFGSDEFERISPVRRVPVYVDGHVTIPDSTVICEYLEDRFRDPPLLPPDPDRRARARWLEEYADSRMGEVFVWRLFNNLVINRYVWGQEVDRKLLQDTIDREIPAVLDYLETVLTEDGYLFDAISIADISIASFFRNADFSGYSVDMSRWPVTGSFVRRILAEDAFASLRPYEEISLRTPVQQHREALADAGAPVSRVSYGTDKPRRGILRT